MTATGDQIKRGIYRDFPTTFWQSLSMKKVGFKVLSVKRDGQPIPWSTGDRDNGKRIYLGDMNATIPPGQYSYEFTYKTDHQLGFFPKRDELYWNATGNGWVFPILKASASVTLPPGIPASKMKTEGYTGPQGSKGKDYTSKVDSSGRAIFAATTKLPPKNGLTIVVSWPKGYITKPTAKQEVISMVKSDIAIRYELIGLAILLIYYIFMWTLVGKDPPKGSIMPLYEAPEGLSPAAIRYIRCMCFDQKCFAASLINMAVKGFLKIDEMAGVYTITKAKVDLTTLTNEEREIADGLLGNSSAIELTNEHYQKIGATYRATGAILKDNYQKQYFTTNRLFMIPGVLITILTLAAGLLMNSSGGVFGNSAGILPGAFITVWLSFWTLGVTALVLQVIKSWKVARYGTGIIGKTGSIIGAIFITLFAIPFIVGELFGLGFLLVTTGPIFMLVLLIAMITNFIFYKLLPAPTKEGRSLLDKIDGFREYLSVAESDNLEMFKGPAITPALFEKFLPYALALDVEQAWSKRFSDALEKAGQSLDRGGYSPMWYSGSMAGLSTGAFASSLGGSLSGAISSSSTAPGSSSGSGGGGSSGGGGGGGGGGGF
ncbi:MAG: DUF2207 domain-containing protein [Armatimonadota bacterium]